MKNTRKLPFEIITELKAPWIKEIKSIVTEYIAKLVNQYKEETEYCGVPEFYGEKELFKEFANTSEDYKNLPEKSKENIARAYGIIGNKKED